MLYAVCILYIYVYISYITLMTSRVFYSAFFAILIATTNQLTHSLSLPLSPPSLSSLSLPHCVCLVFYCYCNLVTVQSTVVSYSSACSLPALSLFSFSPFSCFFLSLQFLLVVVAASQLLRNL